MADTNLLKTLVEPHVRRWLSQMHGIEFEDHEKELKLLTGGRHRFDAVSKDGSIVAGIKTSALRNYASRLPIGAGVIKSTFAEIYFLTLVDAKKKLMVLTDKRFYEYFLRISSGKVARQVELIHCELPKEIMDRVSDIHGTCSKEIGKK